MTLKAYLDNIQTQTGKTPKDFLTLAEQKGLLKEGVKTGQIVDWLQKDYGLGRGHAMAIVLTLREATKPKVSSDETIDSMFLGEKRRWRKTYDGLMTRVGKFGPGVSTNPTQSYISLLRNGRKFAILQVTAERMDIGIKRKGVPAEGRFEAAGSWNAMVTHRVRILEPDQIDAEVLGWMKEAYKQAQPTKRVEKKI